MQIWRKIGIPATMEVTFGLDLFQWMRANHQSSPDILSNDITWKTLFTLPLWTLWEHRNRVVFENTPLNSNMHNTCIRQVVDYFFSARKSLQTKRIRTMQVQWFKPHESWYKLNTNGASLGNPRKTGGGGLIQDHRGTWVKCFSRCIGNTTSVR